MPIVLNGSGPITGVTSLNTTVSDTEIGYLDGVTSAIQSQINTAGGLVKITDSTFSAQSSISVNNCFTSTYDNYRIIVNIDSNSVDNETSLRLRVSGTDNSNNNYYWNGTDLDSSSDTTPGALRSAGLTNRFVIIPGDNTDTGLASFDIYNPAKAVRTALTLLSVSMNATDMRAISTGQIMSVTTAYDGFTLYASAGTITGTVKVYGYRN